MADQRDNYEQDKEDDQKNNENVHASQLTEEYDSMLRKTRNGRKSLRRLGHLKICHKTGETILQFSAGNYKIRLLGKALSA